MTILLAHIVPRDQLVAVHAPLGEVEWPGTVEHIEATLPKDVPLILAPVASGKDPARPRRRTRQMAFEFDSVVYLGFQDRPH